MRTRRDSTGAMITTAEAQSHGWIKTGQHFTQLEVARKAGRTQSLAVIRNRDGSYDLWEVTA